MHPPFTLHVPSQMFARSVEVWTLQADVKSAVALPSAETIPLGGVQRRPRGHHWRPTMPDTLVWIEALDGGDPEQPAKFRDRIVLLPMRGEAKARELVRLPHRFSRVYWGEDPKVALVREYISSENKHRIWHVNPEEKPGLKPEEGEAETVHHLWELLVQDRYLHPGFPLMRQLANG